MNFCTVRDLFALLIIPLLLYTSGTRCADADWLDQLEFMYRSDNIDDEFADQDTTSSESLVCLSFYANFNGRNVSKHVEVAQAIFEAWSQSDNRSSDLMSECTPPTTEHYDCTNNNAACYCAPGGCVINDQSAINSTKCRAVFHVTNTTNVHWLRDTGDVSQPTTTTTVAMESDTGDVSQPTTTTTVTMEASTRHNGAYRIVNCGCCCCTGLFYMAILCFTIRNYYFPSYSFPVTVLDVFV